jgi:hypothetical protein
VKYVDRTMEQLFCNSLTQKSLSQCDLKCLALGFGFWKSSEFGLPCPRITKIWDACLHKGVDYYGMDKNLYKSHFPDGCPVVSGTKT